MQNPRADTRHLNGGVRCRTWGCARKSLIWNLTTLYHTWACLKRGSIEANAVRRLRVLRIVELSLADKFEVPKSVTQVLGLYVLEAHRKHRSLDIPTAYLPGDRICDPNSQRKSAGAGTLAGDIGFHLKSQRMWAFFRRPTSWIRLELLSQTCLTISHEAPKRDLKPKVSLLWVSISDPPALECLVLASFILVFISAHSPQRVDA